jgi:GNAT superfamily N-acetyltransferase
LGRIGSHWEVVISKLWRSPFCELSDFSWNTELMLIRAAQPVDALAVARVHVRSWQSAYRGLLPDAYLDQLSAEDRAAHYDFVTGDPAKPLTLVAEEDGRIRGFASTVPSADPLMSDCGELCALYVDPDHWGHGIGRSLVTKAREHLVTTGFRRALLWVLTGNVRGEKFYLKDGWAADGDRKQATLWGATVDEFRMRRKL